MKFNWSSLTKEQKQIVFLLVLGVVIAGALLYAFVVIPLQEGAERRQLEGNALREKLIKADLALKYEVRAKADGVLKLAQFAVLTNSAVAPFGNAFAWATGQLYPVAQEAGVELENLGGNSQPLGSTGPATAGTRSFAGFTAQMTLQCSYSALLRFLHGLEAKNPLVTVTSLTIDRRETTPGRHQVGLMLEWPIWVKDPAAVAPVGKPGAP